MTPVLIEFAADRPRAAHADLGAVASACCCLSMLAMVTGLILDSVSRGRAEQKRIFYLSMPSGRVERRERAAEQTARRPNRARRPGPR